MFDTQWFRNLIKEKHGSQRKFAKKIIGRNGKPLDHSSVSLLLRDKRSMQLTEARQIADLLDAPLIEVIRRAGIDISPRDLATKK